MRRLLPALCLFYLVPAGAAQFYSLQVSHQGDRYLLSVDAHLAAPLAEVYAVITDYDHLTRIHAAILESRRVKQLDEHTDLVYTVHRGCVLFFCHSIKQMQQVTRPTPQDVVGVTLPEQSNVKMGSIACHLEPDGDGTRMHWNITLEPDFWIPPFFGPSIVQSEMREEGRNTAFGVEKLARQRAGLPPLVPTDAHADSKAP